MQRWHFAVLLGLATCALLPARGAGALALVGFEDSVEQIVDVAVVGDHIFAAAGDAGLFVYDASRRRKPVVVGGLSLGGFTGIVQPGPEGLLYVAVREDGLHILDVGDPASPVEVGRFEVIYQPYGPQLNGISVRNGIALLGTSGGGMLVADVSDPTAPIQLGRYAPNTTRVVRDPDGIHAYVSATYLTVLDISDPTLPTYVGRVGNVGSATDLLLDGDLLYASDSFGFSIVDVSDPAAPVRIVRVMDAGYVSDLELDGDLLFVASNETQLSVYDVSNPTAPSLLGQVSAGAGVTTLALEEALVYAGTRDGGLQVFSRRDVVHPRKVGHLSLYHAQRIALRPRYAYVAGSAHLRALDLADPTTPVPTDIEYIHAWDLELDGDRLYVAGDRDGLFVYDVSLPSDLQLLANLTTVPPTLISVSPLRLTKGGDQLFVFVGGSSLQAFDVSAPQNPRSSGRLALSRSGLFLAHGDSVYVSSYDDELVTVDVSDPAAMFVKDAFPAPSGGLTAAGSWLYHASPDDEGLRVFAIRSGGLLDPVQTLHLPNRAFTPRHAGDRLLAGFANPGGHNGGGAYVFDMAEPDRPRLRGGVYHENAYNDAAIAHGLLYLANDDGLQIYDLGPEYQTQAVTIDVRPESPRNRVAVPGEGWLPVAVLGATHFDAREINPWSLVLGPVDAPAAPHAALEDVNGDGIQDLVARFRVPETGIAAGDTQACLWGERYDGVPFHGCDAIETLPRCGEGFQLALALPAFVALGTLRRRRSVGARHPA